MKLKINEKSPIKHPMKAAPRVPSTREVVESSIEASKADTKQTWDESAKTSRALKWEAEEDECYLAQQVAV